MGNIDEIEDIKIMSTVQCIDCGSIFSVDLDDLKEICPHCKAKNFKAVDIL